jgi:hypothetical protein
MQIGHCRICGQTGALSFEHVPPRAAFNRAGVELFSIEDWLARENGKPTRRGRIQQRGMGGFVLCTRCNNLTGRLYVPELEKWSRAGAQILSQLPLDVDEDSDPAEKGVSFGLRRVRPLRFAKQIVAMMLAINHEGFRNANPALTEFVLDRYTWDLSSKYQLYLALYRGPKSRQAGISGSLDPESGRIHMFAEVAHQPFSYLLSVDEPTPLLPLGNVTHFTDYGYDDEVDIDLNLLVGFGHTIFPGDFRTQAALDRDVAANIAEADAGTPDE